MMKHDHQQHQAEQETPRKGRGRSCLRATLRLFLVLLVVGLLACIATGFAAVLVYQHVTGDGVAGERVNLTVPEGAAGNDIARLLAEAGLIEHELFFRLAMFLEGSDRSLKAGRYELHRGLSPSQLLSELREGPYAALGVTREQVRVTIPEGLTIEQMAARFDNPEAFVEAAMSPVLLARLGIDQPTLEGFLMPNTYFFDREPSEQEVVLRMVEQFERDYADLLAEYPHGAERDKLEVVTIASLIEKEARVEDERSLISAVVHNRLRLGRPLQLDCTLQYALNKYGQRMLYDDLKVDSPYNSYKNVGLPPGPIANPGKACLRAALNPADVKYLYFVSNADGKTHTFSNTIQEHERAVIQYRKEMRIQRQKQRETQRQENQ